ncbi:DEAD/DEAH box helicase family protein [Clostridium estertheticum]|uniref:DEAD/DEAH box helicase family protein n=1 Tax=Clostridium estertheticum TaxID=238834 RepID=UPI00299EEC02|nr:DEAD/DEAH box helicase family protein [Clostridium estertheticum]
MAEAGIGKTYLAAFDSLDFNRNLFVAHKEEILNQAELSFKNIRPNIKTGFFRTILCRINGYCIYKDIAY